MYICVYIYIYIYIYIIVLIVFWGRGWVSEPCWAAHGGRADNWCDNFTAGGSPQNGTLRRNLVRHAAI